MPIYSVFGRGLDSELVFPQLEGTATEACEWTLEVVAAAPPLAPTAVLGEDVVYGDVKVRCFRTAEGYALVYDDTGRFDVSHDGSRIRWLKPNESAEDAARIDVVGRVLALALHASGTLSLHASAVSVGGEGIAFLAPKYHGKSTLTAAMLTAGARLISDDVVAVGAGDPPRLLPGVHHLRLWPDTARAIAVEGTVDLQPSTKLLVSRLPDASLERAAVPFVAVYCLVPGRTASDEPPVRRERMTEIAATIELVRNAKLAPLLRYEDAGKAFSAAVAVARQVPLFELLVQRDLDRLPEVVATIAAWHRAPTAERDTA
jgi:hypothetical protein